MVGVDVFSGIVGRLFIGRSEGCVEVRSGEEEKTRHCKNRAPASAFPAWERTIRR